MKMAHFRRLLGWTGHALTLSRLASAPLLYLSILEGQATVAALLLLAAMLSDMGDGALVRRFGTPSAAGAWFDVIADLAVIMASYTALAPVIGWLPVGAILVTFLAFVLTSRDRAPRYDPVGRNIGPVLLSAVLLAVIAPDTLVQLWVVPIVVGVCAVVVAGRIRLRLA